MHLPTRPRTGTKHADTERSFTAEALRRQHVAIASNSFEVCPLSQTMVQDLAAKDLFLSADGHVYARPAMVDYLVYQHHQGQDFPRSALTRKDVSADVPRLFAVPWSAPPPMLRLSDEHLTTLAEFSFAALVLMDVYLAASALHDAFDPRSAVAPYMLGGPRNVGYFLAAAAVAGVGVAHLGVFRRGFSGEAEEMALVATVAMPSVCAGFVLGRGMLCHVGLLRPCVDSVLQLAGELSGIFLAVFVGANLLLAKRQEHVCGAKQDFAASVRMEAGEASGAGAAEGPV